MLERRERLKLEDGRELRLLSALEVLEARREAEGLARGEAEAALCANACLLARALERDTARPLTPEQREAQVDYVRTNFDYDVMLDRYEEVYHHVIGDPLKEIPSQAKAHSKAAAAQGGAA